VFSTCILCGVEPLLQNFCAELEFLPEFLARSRNTCRILGFVPISIIYFRRIEFVYIKPDRAMARTGADPDGLRAVAHLVVCKLTALIHASVIMLSALFPEKFIFVFENGTR